MLRCVYVDTGPGYATFGRTEDHKTAFINFGLDRDNSEFKENLRKVIYAEDHLGDDYTAIKQLLADLELIHDSSQQRYFSVNFQRCGNCTWESILASMQIIYGLMTGQSDDISKSDCYIF